MPASRIAKPTALLSGAFQTVAATISAQAATNRPVVSGWSGTRNVAVRQPAAEHEQGGAGQPNQMKSTETT